MAEIKYNIVEERQSLTITTNVEFEYEDGSKETVEVAHFEPADQKEIENNIKNRFISEVVKKTIEEITSKGKEISSEEIEVLSKEIEEKYKSK